MMQFVPVVFFTDAGIPEEVDECLDTKDGVLSASVRALLVGELMNACEDCFHNASELIGGCIQVVELSGRIRSCRMASAGGRGAGDKGLLGSARRRVLPMCERCVVWSATCVHAHEHGREVALGTESHSLALEACSVI